MTSRTADSVLAHDIASERGPKLSMNLSHQVA
jgi:hypothetical protein